MDDRVERIRCERADVRVPLRLFRRRGHSFIAPIAFGSIGVEPCGVLLPESTALSVCGHTGDGRSVSSAPQRGSECPYGDCLSLRADFGNVCQ